MLARISYASCSLFLWPKGDQAVNKERQHDLIYNEGEEGYNPYRYDTEPLGDKIPPITKEELQRQLAEIESRKIDGHYTNDADTALSCGLKAQLFRLSLEGEK